MTQPASPSKPDATRPQAAVLPPLPPAPPPKVVTFTRTNSGTRWELTVAGGVRQRDINHLARILRVEFNRMKRRQRLSKATQARKETTDAQGN